MMVLKESSDVESAAADVPAGKSAETAADSAITHKGYETVDPADFDRALKISQALHNHRYETSDLPGIANVTESAAVLARNSETVEKGTTNSETAGKDKPHAHESEILELEIKELLPLKKPLADNHETEEEDEQTLERQLFEFQEQEANEQIVAKDWETAILRIEDILQNPTIRDEEKSWWIYRQAQSLQMLWKWKESLRLFDDGSFADGCGLSTYACGMQTIAEAQFQLGDHARAKASCNAALKIWEKQKVNDEAAGGFFNLCVDQMARITEAMGKEVEARFYRSKTVEGFVFMAVREKWKRDEIERQSKMHVVNLQDQLIRQRKDLLAPFGLIYDCEDSVGSKKPISDGHTITSEKNHPNDFELAFEAGLKDGNTELLDTILLDKICVLKYWPKFLQAAILADNNTYIERLVVYMGANINMQLPVGNSGRPDHSLSLAVSGGCKNAMQTLIELRANINGLFIGGMTLDNAELIGVQTTPLHEAIKRGDMNALTYLLNRNASISLKNRNGMYPLHLAAFRGNREMVSALVKIGAAINAQSYPERETPLHLAVTGRHLGVIEFLVKKGADTTLKNKNGKIPLDLLGSYQSELRTDIRELLTYPAKMSWSTAESNVGSRRDKAGKPKSFWDFSISKAS